MTDALTRVTKTTYYADTQRVDEVIAAQGTPSERRTKNVWTNGLLTETRVWDPASLSYTASYRPFYDQAGRLERFEAPLVAAEQYAFNAFGESSKFSAGTKVVDRLYSRLGQNGTSTWSNAYALTEARGYDGGGRLVSVNNGTLEKTAAYDAWLGTPSYETFKVGPATWKIQSHVFDAAKNYEKFIDAQAGEHDWVYDENNRVKEAGYKPGLGARAAVYSLTYTPGGLVDVATCRDAAGAVIATTTHSYDTRGRKIRVSSGAQSCEIE